MAYSALKTHDNTGLAPNGLHGYGRAMTRPTTGWRPGFPIALGDASSVLESLVGDAEQAFQSYEYAQTPVVVAPSGPVLPNAAAAGTVSFAGNSGVILVVLGLGALALFAGSGGRHRR